jgi:non-heme chloroperoxidase
MALTTVRQKRTSFMGIRVMTLSGMKVRKEHGESTLKTVDVNGTQLHYMERGEKNNNKQSAVVFTHGAVSDYRAWQFQIEPFSQQYRVISYSRRHSYPNRVEDDFHFAAENDGIRQYASDLAEIIKKMQLAPAHLIGHSDGAFVSLCCAYKNPELVKSLVLCEPPILPLLATSGVEEDKKLFQDFWENAIIPAREALLQGNFENGVRIFLDGAMVKGFFDQLPPPVQKSMVDNAKAFLKQSDNPMPREFNLQEVEERISSSSSIPTLFVRGEFSPKFLVRITDILASHFHKSKQVTIPGVTHDVGRATKPEIFNSKVMEFLAANT